MKVRNWSDFGGGFKRFRVTWQQVIESEQVGEVDKR